MERSYVFRIARKALSIAATIILALYGSAIFVQDMDSFKPNSWFGGFCLYITDNPESVAWLGLGLWLVLWLLYSVRFILGRRSKEREVQ